MRIFKQKKEILISLIYILITIGSVVTISAQPVFIADDFSFSEGIGTSIHKEGIVQYVLLVIKCCRECYMKWQGTYTCNFLVYLINPLYNGGILLLRVELITFNLLLFASIYYVIRELTTKKECAIVMMAIFLLGYMNYKSYAEAFFWSNAVVAYNFSLAISLLTMGFAIKNVYKGYVSNKRMIIACILAFLAVGGTLAISGFLMYSLLVILLVELFVTHRVNRRNLIILIVASIGVIINVCAPGNFVRSSVITNQIHIGAALYRTIKIWFLEIDSMINSSLIGICAIIFFFLGYIHYGKKENNNLGIELLLLPLGLFCIFPIALGYDSSIDYYLPSRCLFIIDFALTISILAVFYGLGRIVNKYVSNVEYNTVRLIMIVAILVGVVTNGIKISDIQQYLVLQNVINGSYQNYSKQCEELCDYLEYTNEKDVIITDYPESIDGYIEFGLSNDPEYWVNKTVAKHYGLNSLYISE